MTVTFRGDRVDKGSHLTSTQIIYRYVFDSDIAMEDVESSLLLALWGAECLHGAANVRLDASHFMDLDARACVIDAGTCVGKDINRLFIGFVSREFGPDAFRVERLNKSISQETKT